MQELVGLYVTVVQGGFLRSYFLDYVTNQVNHIHTFDL